MRRKLTVLPALTAALVLGACADDGPLRPEARAETAEPRLATAPVGPQWSLFTSQAPDLTLDAAPGWEVGTRVRTSKAGKVIGFRFWRASGETGTNTARLWTDSGTQLASATFPSGGTGWQTVYLGTTSRVRLQTNTNYRVSVNTNTALVKKDGGYVVDGSLSSGPLYSDAGFYGQPTGSMPATGSASYFFVDVIFEEDVPLPNLYIAAMNPQFYGPDNVLVRVCNNGKATAAASTLQYWHWVAPLSGGSGWWKVQTTTPTPSLGVGGCYDHVFLDHSPVGYRNEYHAWTDVYDVVYESNENDNYSVGSWNRTY